MASVEECPDVCVFEMEEEEELDPRVEDYLEILNNSSQEINLLESELDRARNQFRNLLGKSTQKLKASYDKLGKCVGKARPYYVLLAESKEAQAKAHNAAVQFQRANSIYQVAKETVGLAEERVTNDGNRKDFDSAWQEMLNHATTRFMESEEEKSRCEEMHMAKAMAYATVKLKLDAIEKDIPKIIAKAKPYFDLKDRLEYAMKQERQNVEDLQRALAMAKQKYKATLKSLETISDGIHEMRKAKASSLLPARTPGVGAESINSQTSDTSDLPSINLDIISETSSLYIDDDAVSMGNRSAVSRTPSGCSLASRTPGVGTSSCELVNQNGYSPAMYETSETAALQFNGENDGDGETVKTHRKNLSRVSFDVCTNGTNGSNAETTLESATVGGDDLDLCPVDDLDSSKVTDHDPSEQLQNEICTQNPESCDYSTNTENSSSVDNDVENGCRSSSENCNLVDDATVAEVDSDVEQSKVEVEVTNDCVTNGAAVGHETVSHETVNGHDSNDSPKDALPIHRHRKLRGAQFPILVGLSNCSRLPAPPLCPAPLAFYPPIPQPPQAVTLAQNGGQQNNHMTSDEPMESGEQATDINNAEVEVFV